MGTRRIISLLLIITFALTAATGILFFPYIRFTIGVKDENFWRYIHFLATSCFFGLIIVHIIVNIKALGNYLKSLRFLSIVAYVLGVVIFVGVFYLALYSSGLGFSSPFEQAIRNQNSTPETTLISIPEDFEDGKADGWILGTGWEVKLENGNHVLSCTSESWSQATPRVSGWFNYTLETRVKLISGVFQIRFRTGDVPFRSGYMLGIMDTGFYLNREINENNPTLTGGQPLFEKDEWHQLKIILNKTDIKVYCDDELKMDYTDNDLPLIFGGFCFFAGENSNVLFDDINIQVY
jgi:hypothetical protein